MAIESQRHPGIAHPRQPLPEGPEDLVAFQRWLEAAIPMVRAMGIQAMSEEEGALIWRLALSPSLNDKGTGFGGALTAQATLQGWCWVTLLLRQQGWQRDVVVADASQRFMAPVTQDYRMVCVPEAPADVQLLIDKLNTRGKGSITLKQQLMCGNTLCLEASGRYVVLPTTGN